MKVTVPVSKKEKLGLLSEQIGYLQSSCENFDKGNFSESKRLATTIRVLVHDTSQSISLLKQLGVKKHIRFSDTSLEYNPNNLISHIGLASLKMTVKEGNIVESIYEAFLKDRPPVNKKDVPFNDWWEQIIIVDGKKEKFSRKDLILYLANKEGGAHVDENIEKKFHDLTRGNSIGWEKFHNGESAPFDNRVIDACVRQIAHELIETLKASNIT